MLGFLIPPDVRSNFIRPSFGSIVALREAPLTSRDTELLPHFQSIDRLV
jgi:hypothetical protein